jgi:hypothetical protein
MSNKNGIMSGIFEIITLRKAELYIRRSCIDEID